MTGQGVSRLGDALLALIRLDPAQALFATRGFRAESEASRRALEAAGLAFIHGYNRALALVDFHALEVESDARSTGRLGFAAEGYAMATAISDALPFRLVTGRRLEGLLARTAERHPYLVTVGVGWALARLPWRRRAILQALDPVLASLAFDGWGFNDCYFDARKLASGPGAALRRCGGPLAARSWDRGTGRALWFISGGSVDHALEAVAAIDAERRADLMAGLGLAVTYAGGLDAGDAARLAGRAGELLPWLMQGSAFALEAHRRAGTGTAQTGPIFSALTGLPAEDGVAIVRRTRPAGDPAMPLEQRLALHEAWRERLAEQLQDLKGDVR